MKLKTKNIGKLNNWIQALKNITDKVTFRVNEKDGLKQNSRDPSHVCLMNFQIEKDDFEELEVDGKEEVISVDTEDLSSILRRFKGDDMIVLKVKNNSSLVISSENVSSKSFDIPLLSKQLDEEQDLSNLKYDASATMTIGNMKEEITNVSLVAERLSMKIKKNKFEVKSYQGQGNYSSVYNKEDLENMTMKKESKGTYSISYLEDVLSPLDKKDNIKINLGDNMPLKLESKKDNSHLQYILAPIAED